MNAGHVRSKLRDIGISPMTKTIFLDRDGTIIIDKGYLHDPLQVELEVGAAHGLMLMQQAGYRLVGVTNQSGVGRGYFSLAEAEACNRRVDELLLEYGVEISAWFICPHAPDEACDCRKPLPGLVRQASEKFSIDYTSSFVIGDKDSDVLLAESSGMQGLLVLTGSGHSHADWARATKTRSFDGLEDAAKYIIAPVR
ncbi:UNVERIFIED_ORG: HAD family hydrolase [Roseateles sp. XES5]|nr:HAD family hydrolase [Roseateles sp. XES5]